MGSILLPPPPTGGAAGDIRSVFLDPAAHYTYGQLAPSDDGTGGVDFLERSGFLRTGVATLNVGGSGLTIEDDGMTTILDPGSSNAQIGGFDGPVIHNVQAGYDCMVKVRMNASVADRHNFWVGFITQDIAACTSDDPGVNHAGIAFQNTDTNFQCVSRGNSGQEKTNSLIAPVADAAYFFRVAAKGSSVTLTIYDADLLILFTTEHTVAFPQGATTQRFVYMGRNDGVNGSRPLPLYFAHVTNGQAA